MRQTVDEVLNSMPAGSVICTFMQYSITFCSQPEAASDVIYGVFVRQSIVDEVVKFEEI